MVYQCLYLPMFIYNNNNMFISLKNILLKMRKMIENNGAKSHRIVKINRLNKNVILY